MAIQNRIRELRKNLNLSQIGLSLILGTTQQTVSRMEISGDIPTDLLIKMSGFFNATTDYILGISEYKRDLSGQLRMKWICITTLYCVTSNCPQSTAARFW